MRIESFSTSDGLPLLLRRFDPLERPRARLVFLHGIRSHGGWYERSCQNFADRGFEVHFLDRRGSGFNTAHRGDGRSYRRLILDVAEYLRRLRSTQPGLPIVLAGISWGAKLALGVPTCYPGLAQACMLLGPGLRPQIQPPLLQRLRIALASRLRPDRFFPIPLNEPELFTADPHWQEFIRTHPHDLREATARFLFQSFRFDQFLNRGANRVTVPILLQLAGRDRIIDTGRTRAFLPRLNRAQSITVIDYPEAQHTLEFEPPGHPWERDALDWIERRVLA